MDRLHQVQAVFAAALRPGGERPSGRLDRIVDIGCRAQRDPARHLLGGRVVNVQGVRLDRIDPLAVDVELQIFAHHSTSAYCVPSAYQVLNSSYFGISSEFAFGSMQTCTTAVLPLAKARSMAGPMSSSFSTYSP